MPGDGETALDLLLQQHADFDLLVLDVMLPGKDGFTVATELRKANQYIPLLMLTARGRPEDVLKGFASGADDYLPKPFDLAILLARIRSLLRRREWARSCCLSPPTDNRWLRRAMCTRRASSTFTRFDGQAGGLRHAGVARQRQDLPPHPDGGGAASPSHSQRGKNVSRKQILEEVWGLHEDTDTRAIDNFIVRLRKYIEKDPSKPQHLLTVRGVGYRFFPSPELPRSKSVFVVRVYRARASTSVTSSGCSFAADPVGHRGGHHLADARQWLIAMGPNQLDQAVFAELAELVLRLGHAVAEGDEDVAGLHGQAALAVSHAVEQADHRSGNFQALDAAVLPQIRIGGKCPALE